MSSPIARALKEWLAQPPRAHGEIDEERTVSFLELFYDLVFVVLIAQIAHTLAGDTSWSGVRDFAIVFGLIWIAWSNGSMYHELHGREDGRSRTYIFGQMFLLVVLAVYAAHAAGEDGQGFAITYALLLVLLTLQWYGVRRIDPDEYRATTARYLGGMAVSIVVVAASAGLDDDVRLAVWAVLVVAWIAGGIAQFAFVEEGRLGISMVTESMAERFGLFTIIVLGEVVVGVVDGLSEAERDVATFAAGLLALNVGFGFWWSYFDFVGRRVPRRRPLVIGTWLYVHLPMAAAIAAAGAGMVGLVEHAGDDRTPAATAWLIGGATAALLACLAVLVSTIDHEAPEVDVVRPVIGVVLAGAVASLVIAALRPVSWLLALALTVVLLVVWVSAFVIRADRRAPERPQAPARRSSS